MTDIPWHKLPLAEPAAEARLSPRQKLDVSKGKRKRRWTVLRAGR